MIYGFRNAYKIIFSARNNEFIISGDIEKRIIS